MTRSQRKNSSRIFEKGDTASFACFKKNEDTEPKNMPFTIVWLAVEYAGGLRTIRQKAKEVR